METPKSNDIAIPKQIDRYDLLDRIGAGGMGLIYKAFDTKLKRHVAIKIISDRVKEPSVRANIRERFFNEARAAGGLSHPNLVQVFDFNETEGLAYIVMEHIEGETLDELIKSKGPLNADELMRIGKEVASGLAFAHRKGIVHRDIKPSNIILEAQSGLSKILDFGIAKFINEDEMKLTSTGMVLGSTHYLSPEHIIGKNLDGRSDIFCLGTLLYEAATGVVPFRGQNSSTILYKVVHFDPQDPAELRAGLPAALCQIIMRCLKKSPADRFQKCEDIEKELNDLQMSLRAEQNKSGPISTSNFSTKAYFVRDSQILSALQSQKKLSPAQASQLRGRNAIECILREDLLSEDDLSKAISECLNLPWIPKGRLRAIRVSPESIGILEPEVLRKYNLLPFFLDPVKKSLSFVIDGAHDFQKDEAFADLIGIYSLQFYVGGSQSLRRLIELKIQEKAGVKGARAGFGETGDQTLSDEFTERRVLVIDNHTQNLEALAKLFSGNENQIVLCGTVEEALHKLKREAFDFVWAQRSFIGDELQFETQILKQNPICDIRFYDKLGQEVFQETLSYRKFREFFNRMIQNYSNEAPKTHKSTALITASLAVKVTQAITQSTRALDEVYFACLLWKLDRMMSQTGKGFDLFDGIYRFRYINDCSGERFDGRGNHGLREDQIPLAARVMSLLLLVESVKPNLEANWTEQEVNDLKQKLSQYNAKQLDPRLSAGLMELLKPASAVTKKTRVAIVDSDASSAQKLSSQLKQISAESTIYADGIAALAGIKRDKPDLIISEVLVSKLDGLALCARIRSDESLNGIPVVFLSDSLTPEHSTKALQLGAEDFLSKSQDAQFIMTKLERMLKKVS